MTLPQLPELAFLAVLAACWRQVAMVFDRLRGIFVQRTMIRGQVSLSVVQYLFNEARVLRTGDAFIDSTAAWVRPRNRVQEVAYEEAPIKPVVIIWRGRPLVLRRMSETHGSSDAVPMGGQHGIHLYHLRGTVDLKKLTEEALEWYVLKDTTGQRYRVRHAVGRAYKDGKSTGEPAQAIPLSDSSSTVGRNYLHWSEHDIGAPKAKEPFTSYALGSIASEAREDFRRWLDLKDWYLERGIPWRRGHLLYGQPGTGKTALVRALAQEADMPVFSYDLSSLDNEEFRACWMGMQESAPCIALLEDIDGVFHGRENVLAQVNTTRESLTFDCLLNAIGGIETADGVFVVVTTNRPELLDEALGRPTADGRTTRPGRLDRAYCLPLPSENQRESIIRRIAGEVLPHHLQHTEGMTAAQVTEWAMNLALSKMWKTQEPPAQVADFYARSAMTADPAPAGTNVLLDHLDET